MVNEMLLCLDLRRFQGEGRKSDVFHTVTDLKAQ